MRDIYQASLDDKFAAIVLTIARDLGYGDNLTGLIAERQAEVVAKAEQAVVFWATERQRHAGRLVPHSNLQHLLDEYCAIADHL